MTNLSDDDVLDTKFDTSLSSSEIWPKLTQLSERCSGLSQLDPKSESDFVEWMKDLGLGLRGSARNTDMTMFWQEGLIRADLATPGQKPSPATTKPQEDQAGIEWSPGKSVALGPEELCYDLHFHPFRLWLVQKFLLPRIHIAKTEFLYPSDPSKPISTFGSITNNWKKQQNFEKQVDRLNGIVELAIILEPLYWPSVVGRVRNPELRSERNLSDYREQALEIVRSVGARALANAHEELRIDAGLIDRNSELYLLLRAASWCRREKIVGSVGCAMWIRQIAEIIRQAHTEITGEKLLCEDRCFGSWSPGARNWLYGSDHPTDDRDTFLKRILPRWGLVANTRCRLYVEGDTEYGAFEVALGPALGNGLEIVNVKGGNWADWLKSELQNDIQAERISILVVDMDVSDNLKAIRGHVNNNLIVGMVIGSDPDFEFGNFTLTQLIDAAHLVEFENGQELPPLDTEKFKGAYSGKSFERLYKAERLSRGIKGRSWGQALAQLTLRPDSNQTEENNKFLRAAMCARRAITIDYEFQSKGFKIDPETLKLEPTGWTPLLSDHQ